MELYDHQIESINNLRNGCILKGGVGSGKSRISLAYYFIKVCGGSVNINGRGRFSSMRSPLDLYIITTAKKRNSKEWENECLLFHMSTDEEHNTKHHKVVIDSWNNITKYKDVTGAFFIFDEQRASGSGVWAKTFIKIAEKNQWILVTATPGDVWADYVPVFVANGFFKNPSEFYRNHAIYNRFSKYPKIDKYIGERKLMELRKKITVEVQYTRPTVTHSQDVITGYPKAMYHDVMKNRWNPYTEQPVKDINELCLVLRKICNTDPSKLGAVLDIFAEHPKVIVFYNFNYELDILRKLCEDAGIPYSEWNGQKHEDILHAEKSWAYLVQYAAGAEGWNCIETDTMIFFSQNYSYKATAQAAGRIDRMNTPFRDLYYFYLRSNSQIDLAIRQARLRKKNFNEKTFVNKL